MTSYSPNSWSIGDTVSKAKLDRLESGVAAAITTADAGAAFVTNPASSTAVYNSKLLPFASDSIWRLAIASNATFAASNDSRNAKMSDVNGTGGAKQAWLNFGQYSHPIAYASVTDPLAIVTDTAHTANDIPVGGKFQEYVPATARIAAGTDAHMHVITPDSQFVQEHFGASRVDSTHYNVQRRHQVSLLGSGIGPQNGCRAYGGSAIGGLVRAWEVDPTHPAYTGRIDHALAVALRGDQMLYTSTSPDAGHGAYDAQGYGLKRGYVWPATEQDYNSDGAYTGAIPMGSYFAIPPSVDITTLGLATPQALMLARAAQDYGVYVTDTSGVSAFYLEDDNGSATGAFASALISPPSYASPDLAKLFQALRVVTSNAVATPNGGALGTARRGSYNGAYAAISTLPRIEHAVSTLQTLSISNTILGSAQAKTNSATALPSNAVTFVYFSTNVYTRGSGVTLESPGVLRAAYSGLYLIDLYGSIAGVTDANNFLLELDVNYGNTIEFASLPAPGNARIKGSTVQALSAGDGIECRVSNASSTSRSLDTGFTISLTRISA